MFILKTSRGARGKDLARPALGTVLYVREFRDVEVYNFEKVRNLRYF